MAELTEQTPAIRKLWDARLLPLLAPIWMYKKCISPLLPPACRHYPTCSEYAFEAIKQRGVVAGMTMGAWRVLRCNPWGSSGYDPVEAFRWPWQPKLEVQDPKSEAAGEQHQASEHAPMPSSRIS